MGGGFEFSKSPQNARCVTFVAQGDTDLAHVVLQTVLIHLIKPAQIRPYTPLMNYNSAYKCAITGVHSMHCPAPRRARYGHSVPVHGANGLLAHRFHFVPQKFQHLQQHKQTREYQTSR
jgi:hypothetical protein